MKLKPAWEGKVILNFGIWLRHMKTENSVAPSFSMKTTHNPQFSLHAGGWIRAARSGPGWGLKWGRHLGFAPLGLGQVEGWQSLSSPVPASSPLLVPDHDLYPGVPDLLLLASHPWRLYVTALWGQHRLLPLSKTYCFLSRQMFLHTSTTANSSTANIFTCSICTNSCNTPMSPSAPPHSPSALPPPPPISPATAGIHQLHHLHLLHYLHQLQNSSRRFVFLPRLCIERCSRICIVLPDVPTASLLYWPMYSTIHCWIPPDSVIYPSWSWPM